MNLTCADLLYNDDPDYIQSLLIESESLYGSSVKCLIAKCQMSDLLQNEIFTNCTRCQPTHPRSCIRNLCNISSAESGETLIEDCSEMYISLCQSETRPIPLNEDCFRLCTRSSLFNLTTRDRQRVRMQHCRQMRNVNECAQLCIRDANCVSLSNLDRLHCDQCLQ